MSLLLATVLGIVQALTEFLPVSSSGHLVVFQTFLGPYFQSHHTDVTFDILVHTATLLATILYLRRDVWALLRFPLEQSPRGERARKLLVLLVVGSIPAAMVGIGYGDLIKSLFSSYLVAATGFLMTAFFLEGAHRLQLKSDAATTDLLEEDFPLPSVRQALLIGCAQAVALIPGVSRSGSTIASALLLGLPVSSAIRFSFLLSLPAVGGATLLELDELLSQGGDDIEAYLCGFLSAFFVGYFSLLTLVKMVKAVKLRVFSIYTLLLGLALHLHGLLL